MDYFCFIVPTGVGASIGGFAGDASCYAKEFAAILPTIVNTNVVNGACFYGGNSDILYTEGLALDKFFQGEISLQPSKQNKIGVIFDKDIPQNVLDIHINTMNAVETVYGIKVLASEVTDMSVGVNFEISEGGYSTGSVNNFDTLLRAGEKLVALGAEALAVVCLFDEPQDVHYAQGMGVDPVGGVEAIISHFLVEKFNLPAAHAPAFRDFSVNSKIVDKRASAEYITPTYLPCILQGLYNAPKILPLASQNTLTKDNIKALIMPYDCLNCPPVFESIKHGIPVIAVEENKTVLNDTAESLGIDVIVAKDYREAKSIVKNICKIS